VRTYYYIWQLALRRRSKELQKAIGFDIAHHLTFGNFSFPAGICLANIPFVWGPIGGVDRIPESLKSELSLKGQLFETLRDISHKIFFNIDPLVGMTLRRARIILCRTRETQKFISGRNSDKHTGLILETGKPYVPHLKTTIKSGGADDETNILFSGRLIPLKGVSLALKAFKIFSDNHTNAAFHIVGDGYEKQNLLRLTEHLGLSDRVIYWGALARHAALTKVKACDIFLYPSLREGGTWSLMEAMALEKPVICLDHSGPGEMVTDECGIKVKPSNPEQTIKDLSDALLKLANDPELRKRMGAAGRKRVVEHYTWERKGEFIKKVYEEVLSREIS
ncbi:MAG: glycosyltransferase family 4 protein, partial [Nitrospirota bacterium]